jgi:hypothetical protein
VLLGVAISIIRLLWDQILLQALVQYLKSRSSSQIAVAKIDPKSTYWAAIHFYTRSRANLTDNLPQSND